MSDAQAQSERHAGENQRQRQHLSQLAQCSRVPRNGAVAVPSISEISSQSSDEDTGRRRRRRGVGDEGEVSVPQASSLVSSFRSANVPLHCLEPSESSGTETEHIVPSPATERKLALEKANKNPQVPPKMPAHLKRALVS